MSNAKIEKLLVQLKSGKKGIQLISQGLFELKNGGYENLEEALKQLDPLQFRDVKDRLSALIAMEAGIHHSVGTLMANVGCAINHLEKGDPSVLNQTVREGELGTKSAATGKKKAAVG